SLIVIPKVLLLAWDRVSKTKDAFGNKQYKPEDIQELIRKLFNDVQNIHEELADVEDLVPIPSESEGIPDDTYDVPFRDNSPPLDISKDQFEDFSDSNDDSTSIDDNSFSIEDIDYVEASPLDSEPVILEESPSPCHIPVEDSDSFFEKFDTSLSYSNKSLPEFETFSDHTEETSSGNTTTHADNSLP
nr:hypothetical protein [Tanacetum cinerariifolium]